MQTVGRCAPLYIVPTVALPLLWPVVFVFNEMPAGFSVGLTHPDKLFRPSGGGAISLN